MMTPQRWRQVKELLGPALELDPARRIDYLNHACGSDAFLREDVERLLAAEGEAGADFLNHPLTPEGLTNGLPQHPEIWIGRQLGAYQIVEAIGVGGMGEVYRAVRADDEYRKQVAIKLVRSGQDSSFFLNRFKNERQILAGLDHPNIARLLDGGTSKDGVPYFVMELIEGQRIDEYCNGRKLATEERLGLLLQVCSAVQYAHQRLIVHRDIKPGNILVTADGVPKLLDFGVAKILESNQGLDQPRPTISLFRLLTPEYASPEQVKNGAITTASDVYSLGVVLYELLTGRSPYPVSSRTPHEISCAVCEIEPEKPSSAARRTQASAEGREHQTPTAIATGEGSVEKLSKRLAGDLDNIVLMALRKEPERRYASVEQLAQDIRRHLANLPVVARQDTLGYRTSKFIARHKVAVAAAATVVMTLLVALVVTVREARIAQRRFNDVRQLANSLIFEIHDSIKGLPGSTPARKLIVDRALQYLDSLSQGSRGDVSLQRELASAYERLGLVQGHYLQNNLGDTKGSLDSYRKALKIRQQVCAKSSDWNDRLALAQSYRLVANQQWAMGDHRGALENITRAVAISESLSAARPNTWEVLKELGFDYEVAGMLQAPGPPDGPSDPVASFRRAVTVDEAMLRINPDDLWALDAYAIDMSHLGGAFERTDINAALPYYRQELEIEQKLHQRSADIRYARGVARAYGEIAGVYEKMGDYPHALENNSRDLAIYRDLIRVDPQNTLLQQGLAITYVNTAIDLGKTGKTTQSLEYMDKSLEIMQAVVAAAPESAAQRAKLAAIYGARGSNLIQVQKPVAALKEFDAARAIYESFHKVDPSDTGASLDAASCSKQMGEGASVAGNSKLAADYFHQALAVVEPLLSSPKTDLVALYVGADAYSGLGDLNLQEARRPHQNRASQRENWTQARGWYLKSLDAWSRIEHPVREAPNGVDVGDPAKVAKNLRLCEIALTKLGAAARR